MLFFFIWSIFLEHKTYFQILNISTKYIFFLYSDQELVKLDKILRSECENRKENHFVEDIFRYYTGLFRVN